MLSEKESSPFLKILLGKVDSTNSPPFPFPSPSHLNVALKRTCTNTLFRKYGIPESTNRNEFKQIGFICWPY